MYILNKSTYQNRKQSISKEVLEFERPLNTTQQLNHSTTPLPPPPPTTYGRLNHNNTPLHMYRGNINIINTTVLK